MNQKLIPLLILFMALAACGSAVESASTPAAANDIAAANNVLQSKPLSTATGEVEKMPDNPPPTRKPPAIPSTLPTRAATQVPNTGPVAFAADDGRIRYNGRFDFQDPLAPAFDWSATGIEFTFSGTALTLLLQDGRNSYNLILDGQHQVLLTETGVEEYRIAESLESGQHHFSLSKRTEAYVGSAVFKGLIVTGGTLEQPPPPAERLIEFIGDSITTGYGNEGESPQCWFTPATQNADQTYAAMTARELDAGYTLIALSGLGVIRNLRAESAISSETAIDFVDRALGLNPYITWPAGRQIPDAVVINLGTNDFSSEPFPFEEEFIIAYMELMAAVRRRYPEAHIFAVAGPLMFGPAHRVIETAVERFRLTNNDERLTFMPIEDNLERTAADFGCDWHPNINGHRKIAAQLTAIMADTLGR